MTTPHQWTTAIDDFIDHKLLIGLAATSAKAYAHRLTLVAKQLGVDDPWSVTPALEPVAQLVSAIAGDAAICTAHLTADTRRGYRTAVRGFYQWAVDIGLRRVPAPRPRPSPVPDDVYAAALRAADARERLLLRLGAEHGLRRGEIACVHSRDLLRDLDGWSLVVHGKGNKERVVPLTLLVARRLLELGDGYAFPGNKDGHLSPWWVGRLLSRLLGDFTGHKLRHRAGSRWNDLCEDLAVVQDLLGHADPRTTRLYVASNRAKMRRVVEDAAA